jgi:hypothetical protein
LRLLSPRPTVATSISFFSRSNKPATPPRSRAAKPKKRFLIGEERPEQAGPRNHEQPVFQLVEARRRHRVRRRGGDVRGGGREPGQVLRGRGVDQGRAPRPGAHPAVAPRREREGQVAARRGGGARAPGAHGRRRVLRHQEGQGGEAAARVAGPRQRLEPVGAGLRAGHVHRPHAHLRRGGAPQEAPRLDGGLLLRPVAHRVRVPRHGGAAVLHGDGGAARRGDAGRAGGVRRGRAVPAARDRGAGQGRGDGRGGGDPGAARGRGGAGAQPARAAAGVQRHGRARGRAGGAARRHRGQRRPRALLRRPRQGAAAGREEAPEELEKVDVHRHHHPPHHHPRHRAVHRAQ